MENKRGRVGRPKGFKVSDETKAKVSKAMKYYYANMTDEQKKVREICNNIKSEVYSRAMREYYTNLQKKLITWYNITNLMSKSLST